MNRVFISSQLGGKYIRTWHTDVICDYLERVETGEIKNLIVEMPPRHGKSEHVSRYFPSWVFGRNPRKYIIHASHTNGFAEKFGRDVRDIVTSEKYLKIFPGIKIRQDQNSKTDWKLVNGGQYIARGVGGATTGEGADLFIVDDPYVDWSQANSLVILESTWDWYQSVVNTRMSPGGCQILMMTRWNTSDIIGRVLEQEGEVKDGGKWTRLRIPAICETPKHDRDIREVGDALWPEMYPINVLEDKRKSNVRKFAAMYQQDPIAASGNTFKKEDFRYFNLSDLKKEDFTVAIHCDPAFSTSKSSDDVGIAVTARHKTTKEIYVLDVLGEPLAPSESYAYLLSLAERWKDWTLEFISIEEATISKDQQDFLHGFEKYLRDNGKFYTVLLFKPRGQGRKEDRIKISLEPMFNRHAIYFRGDQKTEKHWIKLEEQLLKFPNSVHDDILDAVSQGVVTWEQRGSGISDNGESFRKYLQDLKRKKEQLEINKKNARVI